MSNITPDELGRVSVELGRISLPVSQEMRDQLKRLYEAIVATGVINGGETLDEKPNLDLPIQDLPLARYASRPWRISNMLSTAGVQTIRQLKEKFSYEGPRGSEFFSARIRTIPGFGGERVRILSSALRDSGYINSENLWLLS